MMSVSLCSGALIWILYIFKQIEDNGNSDEANNLKKIWQKERQGKKKELLEFYKEVVQTLEEVSEKEDTDIVPGNFILLHFTCNYLCMGQLNGILATNPLVNFFLVPSMQLACTQYLHLGVSHPIQVFCCVLVSFS